VLAGTLDAAELKIDWHSERVAVFTMRPDTEGGTPVAITSRFTSDKDGSATFMFSTAALGGAYGSLTAFATPSTTTRKSGGAVDGSGSGAGGTDASDGPTPHGTAAGAGLFSVSRELMDVPTTSA
jgi:hypothetical protein